MIDAQRVPPSACSTSQSILIVRSPSAREIGDRAQAAPDQPLDLLRASGLLAFGGLAPHPRVRRARQHAVLGGEPALALALEKRRHAFLDAGRAQHLRVAGLDQHRAFGVPRVAAGDAERTQLVGAPPGRTSAHRGSPNGQGAIIASRRPRCRRTPPARARRLTRLRSSAAAPPRAVAARPSASECGGRQPVAAGNDAVSTSSVPTSRSTCARRPSRRRRAREAHRDGHKCGACRAPRPLRRTSSGTDERFGVGDEMHARRRRGSIEQRRRSHRRGCRRRAGCGDCGSPPSGNRRSRATSSSSVAKLPLTPRTVDERQPQHDRRDRRSGARSPASARSASSLLCAYASRGAGGSSGRNGRPGAVASPFTLTVLAKMKRRTPARTAAACEALGRDDVRRVVERGRIAAPFRRCTCARPARCTTAAAPARSASRAASGTDARSSTA